MTPSLNSAIDQVSQAFLAITIIAGMALWIYMKRTGKTFKEVMSMIKEALGGTNE